MGEGYLYVEVEGDRIERLTFRRADKPGALVEVSLNGEKINVEARALLLAVRSLQED